MRDPAELSRHPLRVRPDVADPRLRRFAGQRVQLIQYHDREDERIFVQVRFGSGVTCWVEAGDLVRADAV